MPTSKDVAGHHRRCLSLTRALEELDIEHKSNRRNVGCGPLFDALNADDCGLQILPSPGRKPIAIDPVSALTDHMWALQNRMSLIPKYEL
jgi:hypothetical protein